ncbi:MAG: DHH family phosphoesterase [Lachnospiraceae bacterium]|nr:DHH family phosphoesterase [Lachnospiraceae bacterium]
MKLSDLLVYNEIWIQCHDNPDPDTIGSGFALYLYYKAMNHNVRLFYSGKNMITKTNLLIMKDMLNIPLEYISPEKARVTETEGLLLTVDCQYGAGNVTKIGAKHVATIDHHPMESGIGENLRICPELGSCATLVWKMLCEEKFPVSENKAMGTALYYGLYTDTNQFSELFGSEDLDMRDALVIDHKIMQKLRKTNLSLRELEVAGIAMKNYFYNAQHRYAIIKTLPCDSNVLGLIADFLMQVGEVDLCVVYNEVDDGYKLSVRSCTREVNSNELAAYLTRDIGTGGGHYEKAGGFISKRLFYSRYRKMDTEEYFKICLSEYCESFELIDDQTYEFPEGKDIKKYIHIDRPTIVVRPESFLDIGSKVTLRWGKYITDLEIVHDEYWALERGGYIQRFPRNVFNSFFEPTDEEFPDKYSDVPGLPTVRSWNDGRVYSIAGYAVVCRDKGPLKARGMKLTRNVKLFPEWGDGRYIPGYTGDYLMMSEKDKTIFIEPGNFFETNYVPDEE